MGYSCTVAADNCLQVVFSFIASPTGPSNTWKYKGETFFLERGKEQPDGSITGTVYRFDLLVGDDNRCQRAGSVRINPDGSIVRFSFIPKAVKNKCAEMQAAGKFNGVLERQYSRQGVI